MTRLTGKMKKVRIKVYFYAHPEPGNYYHGFGILITYISIPQLIFLVK